MHWMHPSAIDEEWSRTFGGTFRYGTPPNPRSSRTIANDYETGHPAVNTTVAATPWAADTNRVRALH